MGMLKTMGLLTAGCQFITNEAGERVASSLAGKYVPSHIKNGQYYPACWRGSFFVNDRNQKVGDAGTVIQVAVWNGRNAKPGQGAADKFAKQVSVGQTCLMDLTFKPWTRLERNADGTPVLRKDRNGQLTEVSVVVPGWQYVNGSYRWIMDSNKQIALEIARGKQYLAAGRQIPVEDFYARPNTDFNTSEASAAWQAWMNTLKQRREIAYDGRSRFFGYAIVELPDGAQMVNGPMPANMVSPIDSGQELENEINNRVNSVGFIPPLMQPQQQQMQQQNLNVNYQQFQTPQGRPQDRTIPPQYQQGQYQQQQNNNGNNGNIPPYHNAI